MTLEAPVAAFEQRGAAGCYTGRRCRRLGHRRRYHAGSARARCMVRHEARRCVALHFKCAHTAPREPTWTRIVPPDSKWTQKQTDKRLECGFKNTPQTDSKTDLKTDSKIDSRIDSKINSKMDSKWSQK